jgi:hypothetical protein
MWTNSANWSATAFPSGSETATFDKHRKRQHLDQSGRSVFLSQHHVHRRVRRRLHAGSRRAEGHAAERKCHLAGRKRGGPSTVQTDLELPLSNSGITFRNDNPSQTLAFRKKSMATPRRGNQSVYVQGTDDHHPRQPRPLFEHAKRLSSVLRLPDAERQHAAHPASLDGTNAVLNIALGKP